MSDIRAVILDLTGHYRVHIQARMAELDGPVGVEGYIGDNQVIGLYEGNQRVAFTMGNGTAGHLSPDGSFSYQQRSTPERQAAGLIPREPPIPDGERTVDMIKNEIRGLFVLSSKIDLVDWREPG